MKIYIQVRDLGVPEIADVIGGQIFAGANGRYMDADARKVNSIVSFHLKL